MQQILYWLVGTILTVGEGGFNSLSAKTLGMYLDISLCFNTHQQMEH